ncbi:MerR family transcriptional regulator [bacterium]|nr:MerR family transcriptional regulator [bacterium]
MTREEPRYTIGIVAAMMGVHPQTLRTWERKRLVIPLRRGGRRLYSERNLEELRRIVTLTQDLGVNLAGVEVILRMRRREKRMKREMESFLASVKDLLMREKAAEAQKGALVRVVNAGPTWEEDPL